jgi:hypothetical protein
VDTNNSAQNRRFPQPFLLDASGKASPVKARGPAQRANFTPSYPSSAFGLSNATPDRTKARAKQLGVDLSGAKTRTIPRLAAMHVRVGFNLSIRRTPRAGAEPSVTSKFPVFENQVSADQRRLLGVFLRAEIT